MLNTIQNSNIRVFLHGLFVYWCGEFRGPTFGSDDFRRRVLEFRLFFCNGQTSVKPGRRAEFWNRLVGAMLDFTSAFHRNAMRGNALGFAGGRDKTLRWL